MVPDNELTLSFLDNKETAELAEFFKHLAEFGFEDRTYQSSSEVDSGSEIVD